MPAPGIKTITQFWYYVTSFTQMLKCVNDVTFLKSYVTPTYLNMLNFVLSNKKDKAR